MKNVNLDTLKKISEANPNRDTLEVLELHKVANSFGIVTDPSMSADEIKSLIKDKKDQERVNKYLTILGISGGNDPLTAIEVEMTSVPKIAKAFKGIWAGDKLQTAKSIGLWKRLTHVMNGDITASSETVVAVSKEEANVVWVLLKGSTLQHIPVDDGPTEYIKTVIRKLQSKYIPTNITKTQYVMYEGSMSDISFRKLRNGVVPVVSLERAAYITDKSPIKNPCGRLVKTSSNGIFSKILRSNEKIVVSRNGEEMELIPSLNIGTADTADAEKVCENSNIEVVDFLKLIGSFEFSSAILKELQSKIPAVESAYLEGTKEPLNEWMTTFIREMFCIYGIGVEASGKAMRFCFIGESSSSGRKGVSTFIICESDDEFRKIQNRFLNLYDDATMDDIARTGIIERKGEEYRCNLQKYVTRLFQESSSSHDIGELGKDPEKKDLIAFVVNGKVIYAKDAETYNIFPFLTMEAGTNNFVHHQNEKRKYTRGDGQCYGSYENFSALAALVCANGYTVADHERFVLLWDMCGKNVNNIDSLPADLALELRALIGKCPSVFQIRLGGCKGLLVRVNLEAIPRLANYSYVITDSVRKFATDLNLEHLQILGWVHHGNNWTAMYSQALQVLKFQDRKALLPILEYHRQVAATAMSDPATALTFLKSFGTSEEIEEDVNPDSMERFNRDRAAEIIKANANMIKDRQVQNILAEAIDKRFQAIQSGNIQIYGANNAFIICDPYDTLKGLEFYGPENFQLEEDDMPFETLESFRTENVRNIYYNGESGVMGAVRAPIICGFEFTKFTGIADAPEQYQHYRDIAVLVGSECAWDRLGGADFDGDKIKLIRQNMLLTLPDGSTVDCGKIIIDAIPDEEELYVPGESAVKKVIDFNTHEGIINYRREAMPTTKNRVGIFTNAGSHFREIAWTTHFLAKECIDRGLKGVEFVGRSKGERKDIIEKLGDLNLPVRNGMLVFPSFKTMSWDRNTRMFMVPEEADPMLFAGTMTVDKLNEMSARYKHYADEYRPIIGLEIDGQKTGIYGEGKAYFDLIAAGKKEEAEAKSFYKKHLNFTSSSIWEYARKVWRGRVEEKKDENGEIDLPYNTLFLGYSALSTLSIEATKARSAFKSATTDKINFSTQLTLLLTPEERQALYAQYPFGIIAHREIAATFLTERKTQYGKRKAMLRHRGTTQGRDAEEIGAQFDSLQEEEANALMDIARTNGIPMETMAVACYRAAYNKESEESKSLSYGWLLYPWLLKVLRRSNSGIAVFNMGKNPDVTALSAIVIDGVMTISERYSDGTAKTRNRKCDITLKNGLYRGYKLGESWYVKVNKNNDVATAAQNGVTGSTKLMLLGLTYNIGETIGCADGKVNLVSYKKALWNFVKSSLGVSEKDAGTERYADLVNLCKEVSIDLKTAVEAKKTAKEQYDTFLTKAVESFIAVNGGKFTIQNYNDRIVAMVGNLPMGMVKKSTMALEDLIGKTLMRSSVAHEKGSSMSIIATV